MLDTKEKFLLQGKKKKTKKHYNHKETVQVKLFNPYPANTESDYPLPPE